MTYGKKLSKKTVGNVIRAKLFENRLALTLIMLIWVSYSSVVQEHFLG